MPDLRNLRQKIKLSGTEQGDGMSRSSVQWSILTHCSDLGPSHRHPDDYKVLQEAQVSSEDHPRHERTGLHGS